MEKTCALCQQIKPTSEFFRNRATKDGLNRICKLCSRDEKRRRYQSMSKKDRQFYSSRWKVMKKFGFTEDSYKQYLDKIESLPDVCEICGSTENLCFDHDHSDPNPHVRGVLCHSCNVGLGHFRDNTLLLKKAIDYLQTKTPNR